MKSSPRHCVLPLMSVVALSYASCLAQVATITPVHPTFDQALTFVYNPNAQGALLAGAKEMTAEVLVFRGKELPVLKEFSLTLEGEVWKGTWKFDEEGGNLLLVRFGGGDKKDENAGQGWTVMPSAADGKPVRGAYEKLGVVFAGGGYAEMKHERSLEKAQAAVQKELELYPDNWSAQVLAWQLMLRVKPGEETKARVKVELQGTYDAHRSNEEAVAALLPFFDQTGQKDQADKIRAAAITSNPKGHVAMAARYSEAMAAKEPQKSIELAEKFLRDFPQSPMTETFENMLVRLYGRTNQGEKAAGLIGSMKHPKGEMFNSLAWSQIEKNQNLEQAVVWAKKGVDLLRNPDPAVKPSYMSKSKWEEQSRMMLGMALDTYGFGLVKLNKHAEAEPVLEESYRLMKGVDADMNVHYVECLLTLQKNQKALDNASEIIGAGKANERLLELHKTAYVQMKGSEAGYAEFSKELDEKAAAAAREKMLRERLNTPAVDFELRGLDGKVVSLRGLKGKVVVVDFWATWCGPCKMSFPFLQKVYDKYKDNSKVAILALNAWERVAGAEREAAVKKFMADNKYTFPVLYDEGTIEKYGVRGIPTKFVIDREGKLQFQSIGFDNGDDMVRELTMQIDMLLSDQFYR